MWWIAVGIGVGWALKKVLEPSRSTPPPRRITRERSPHEFAVRGAFEGRSALVVGRTGAGKSSLINMLRGQHILEVGDVGSTTRWIEGVPCDLGSRTITMVDSPGIGEALTDEAYNTGIVDWFARNSSSVACVVLVLQADAKAHADDLRLIGSLASVAPKPVIIAVNQADKMNPVRERFTSDDWQSEVRSGSTKSRHVAQKLDEVGQQFEQPGRRIRTLPVASEPGSEFNRAALRAALDELTRPPA